MFTQRIHDCDEHDACHRIDCVTDEDLSDEDGNLLHRAGDTVWESHAPNHTHPECRANNDYPLEDQQGNQRTPVEMCDDCLPHFR